MGLEPTTLCFLDRVLFLLSYGYQGTFVGYPFQSATGAKCMVKVTGTEGFVECTKKTSAGYNDNYAQCSIGASCST